MASFVPFRRIQAARESMQMPQEILASMVDVSVETIDLIEKGAYIPSIELCIRIACALGRDLNGLFWEESWYGRRKI